MKAKRESLEQNSCDRGWRHRLWILSVLAALSLSSVLYTQASGAGSTKPDKGWQDQKTEEKEINQQGDQKVEGGLTENTDDLGNKSGSAKIYGALGSIKTDDDADKDGLIGMDIDEDGEMDIYIDVKDIIEVKVPLKMNMTAGWDSSSVPEEPAVLSAIGTIENLNPHGGIKAELIGFEKSADYADSDNAASQLNITDTPSGDDDINIMAQAELSKVKKEENAFAQSDSGILNEVSVAGRSSLNPLLMGTLGKAGDPLSKGAFYFAADYKKGFTVKYETVTKTKPIVYTAVYCFTPL